MHPMKELPPDMLERFTRLGEHELALVALDPHSDDFIAVGRFAPIAGSQNAEFGLVVTDAWQHQGIGRVLLERLCRAARDAGYAALHGYVLAENREMLDLVARLGFRPVERDGAALVLERQLR